MAGFAVKCEAIRNGGLEVVCFFHPKASYNPRFLQSKHNPVPNTMELSNLVLFINMHNFNQSAVLLVECG